MGDFFDDEFDEYDDDDEVFEDDDEVFEDDDDEYEDEYDAFFHGDEKAFLRKALKKIQHSDSVENNSVDSVNNFQLSERYKEDYNMYRQEQKWTQNKVLDKWNEETEYVEYSQELYFEKINNISKDDHFYFSIIPDFFSIQIRIMQSYIMTLAYSGNIRLTMKSENQTFNIPLKFEKKIGNKGSSFLHVSYSYLPNYIDLLKILAGKPTIKLLFERNDNFDSKDSWSALLTLKGGLPLDKERIANLENRFEAYKKQCFQNLKNDSIKVLNQYAAIKPELTNEIKELFANGTVEAISSIVRNRLADFCFSLLKIKRSTTFTFENLVVFYQGFFLSQIVDIAYKRLGI